SRGEPGGDDIVGDGAAGAAVRADTRIEPDDVDKLVWELDRHAAVCSRSQYRRCRARGAGGDQCGVEPAADGSSEPTDLQQDYPCGFANSDLGADLDEPAAVADRGSCGDHALAEDFAITWGGPGQHRRRAAACGADSGEPNGPGSLRPKPRGSSYRVGTSQRRPGQGHLRWSASGVYDRRERPVADQRWL